MCRWKHRKALHSDIPAIMTIIGQAQASMKALGIDQWQDGYPDACRFEEDIDLGQCYIFEDSTAIEGVIIVTFHPEICYETISGSGWLTNAFPYAVIHRMAVSTAARSKGLAKEMTAFAEELCREEKVISLRVDTHRGNIPMQKFLEKNKFSYCGRVDYKIPCGDPIRMAYEKIIR